MKLFRDSSWVVPWLYCDTYHLATHWLVPLLESHWLFPLESYWLVPLNLNSHWLVPPESHWLVPLESH